MPTVLKRYYGKGDLHFVAFSCYRRLPLLASERAWNLFVEELARVRTVRVPVGWLCGDAEPYTLADERTEKRDTVDSDTDVEAKSFEKDEEANKEDKRTARIPV